ncbi:MAG: hypothetical protein JWM40_3078 [Frankiales bacterium]|nr:hypothetical protein [Frankiales bacterium]
MRLSLRSRPAALSALVVCGLAAASLSVAPSAAAATSTPGWGSTFHKNTPYLGNTTHNSRNDGVHQAVLPVNRTGRTLATGRPINADQAMEAADLARTQPKVVSGSVLSTWVVHYDADFNANTPAKDAFQRAVDTWSHIVKSSVPIVVDAQLTAFSDASQLGGAGPTGFISSKGGIWYPVALANALSGKDQATSDSDISADFASTPNLFYYGADPTGITTASCGGVGKCYDFESVVLHELGHGLGFVGSLDARPNSHGGQTVFYGVDYFNDDGDASNDQQPLVYDLFAQTSSGTAILDYPDASTSLYNAATSNALFWDGPEGAGADRGRMPRLYAPYNPNDPNNSFEEGSSFSHLSDASYPQGDADSLMTPFAEANDITRDPGEVMLGMFRDMGWVTPALPGAQYTPLANPVQVYDSGKVVSNGTVADVAIAGANGVPSNATAVVLNLTAAATTTANSQLFAYARPRPAPLSPRPLVPNLVAAGGYTKDGLTTVPLSGGAAATAPGRVRFLNVGGAAHNYAAVVGYFTTEGGTPYVPVAPRRVIDTRIGKGIPKARIGGSVAVTVPGVPPTATAVVLHVTGINPSNTSTIQVFSSDVTTPNTGNDHLKPGQSATNLVISKLGADHKIKVRVSLGGTDLVIELVGYYDPSGNGRYRPVLAQRLFGPVKLGASTKDFKVVGAGEGWGVPVGAKALVLDTVASFPTATTFQSTYATGNFPGITTLTVFKGKSATGPTMTIPSAGGQVRVKNAAGTSTDSLDLFGYYAA